MTTMRVPMPRKPPTDRTAYGSLPSRVTRRSSILPIVWFASLTTLLPMTFDARYALNLKREFPHIPFYADFWRWADWGETLMALHIGYETVEPWPFKRIDTPDEKSHKAGLAPKTLLK